MAAIVAFHAHPDDVVLLTGGTIAWLAAEGHRVIIVAARDDMWADPAARLPGSWRSYGPALRSWAQIRPCIWAMRIAVTDRSCSKIRQAGRGSRARTLRKRRRSWLPC
jgi:hypothetical protein